VFNGITNVITDYTNDIAGGLMQALADNEHMYLYGIGRIAQYNGDGKQSSTAIEYFLTDALGSVRQLVNQKGQVTLAKSYEPFVETLSSAGDGESAFAYTGEAVEAMTGYVYLRAENMVPHHASGTTKSSDDGFRLDCSCGDVSGHIFANYAGTAAFIQANDVEPGVGLPTDLIIQAVTVFERPAQGDVARQHLGEVCVSVGQPVFYFQNALIYFVQIEDIEDGIHEASQQRSTRAQDAVGLMPHRANLVDEQVGNGVEDQIEAAIREDAQVAHVAFDGAQVCQPFTGGYFAVATKLAR